MLPLNMPAFAGHTTAREVFPQAAHPVSFVGRVMCLTGFLLPSHQDEVSFSLPLASPAQIESQKSEGLPVQQVYHLGFLLVQFHTDKSKLFLEPLQGAFGPASFCMMAADGND